MVRKRRDASANLRIRIANSNDVSAIAAVLAASFPEYKPLYTEEAYAATTPSKAVIKSRFAGGEMWVAEFEEQIVGTVSVVSQNESFYIRSMAMAADYSATNRLFQSD